MSNASLDKPGRLDAAEWDAVRKHAQFTEEIVGRIPQFVFDAITAARPYREAVPIARTLEIMSESVGTAIDSACFEALRRTVATLERSDRLRSKPPATTPAA